MTSNSDKPGQHADTEMEREYVRLEAMTPEDIAFNIARLRKEADAAVKHADALEAWAANRKSGGA